MNVTMEDIKKAAAANNLDLLKDFSKAENIAWTRKQEEAAALYAKHKRLVQQAEEAFLDGLTYDQKKAMLMKSIAAEKHLSFLTDFAVIEQNADQEIDRQKGMRFCTLAMKNDNQKIRFSKHSPLIEIFEKLGLTKEFLVQQFPHWSMVEIKQYLQLLALAS